VARAKRGGSHEDWKRVSTVAQRAGLRDDPDRPRAEPDGGTIFPIDGPDADVVARTLRRLADRDPFDPTDDVTLRALRAILEAELGEELADARVRRRRPGTARCSRGNR
jgi:hypothetical protein